MHINVDAHPRGTDKRTNRIETHGLLQHECVAWYAKYTWG